MTEPLVEVSGLKQHYYERDALLDRLLGYDPVTIHAVDGVSFEIDRGETLGLIGESGCGKSTVGETLLGLEEPTDGEIRFDGQSLAEMSERDRDEFRKQAQIIFQDPFSSLDPRMTVAEIVREPLDVHDIGSAAERRNRVADLVERVGLSADYLDRYPRQLSGGQAQRIGIARALTLDPDFVVCDEPVSALDVSVQAQVLNLFADVQEEFDLTYLFIAHDLSVIRMISDRVAVMYLGEIVEVGDVESIFTDPSHPYTQGLLESIPRAETAERERSIDPIAGNVPSPRTPPDGCRFHPRCPHAREACAAEAPAAFEAAHGGTAACFRAVENHDYWDSPALDVAPTFGDERDGTS